MAAAASDRKPEDGASAAVYRHYDQAALDREYDNGRKVAEETLRRYRAGWAADNRRARETLTCSLDIPYGTAPGETLDVFRPAGTALAPVQIYIHGGYWCANDKSDCSYVALGVTGAGCVSVVINYGLIPTVDLAELIRQCRAALCWVRKNIEAYGGNPERIYVTGHSAGGHLAAMLLATDYAALDPAVPQDTIKGVVALSGIYELEPIRRSFLQRTLGFTPEDVVRFSPVRLRSLVPAARLVIAVGAEEGPEYLRQVEDLAAAWRDDMPDLTVAVLPDTDHFSIRASLHDRDSTVCRLIWSQMGLAETGNEPER